MNSWVIASWFLFALLLFCYFLWLGYHIKMRRSLNRVSFGGRGLGGDPSPYGCCPSPSKNIPPPCCPCQSKKLPSPCCSISSNSTGIVVVGQPWRDFIHCFILTITRCSWSVSPVSWSVYSI